MQSLSSLDASPDRGEQSPIWLVGHSIPVKWGQHIETPLDPRHPTRHNTWSSVLSYLQDRLFVNGPYLRLDASKLHEVNAFQSAADATTPLNINSAALIKRKAQLSEELNHGARIVITLGADAFALVRASIALSEGKVERSLTIEELGKEFRASLNSFNPQGINVVPLLHASAARRSWPDVGPKFSGPDEAAHNYFEYVGNKLGDLLLTHGREWPVWRTPDDLTLTPRR